MSTRRTFIGSASAFALAAPSILRAARAADAPGVTDAEIRVGQTLPYSGPASAYGMIGRAELAYLRMINESGGVNGRKITLVSLDDGYSPPKTVEQTRRLIEVENVAFLHGSLGTAPNLAVRGYLNTAKVPQLSVQSGASLFADPEHYPWTVPGNFQYRTEGRIFAKHIVATRPDAKIALLYQNDDFGRDYLKGIKDVLGADRGASLVRDISYETTDPTVDSQVIALQSSGADTLVIAATPKFAAQALRKTFDLGWSPTRYLTYASASIPAVLKPAGIEKTKGVITTAVLKDPSDPSWADDADMKKYIDFIGKYAPGVTYTEFFASAGYSYGEALVYLIRQCGDDLSRENVLKQATQFKDIRLALNLPGVTINISPTDYTPYHQARLQSFDGQSWRLFGELLSG
jgi:branched-chain amino acid transport system substrate-binding protein